MTDDKIVDRIGVQTIIKSGGKYFIHCKKVGVWAFYISTLAESRRLAVNYRTGILFSVA